MAAPIPLPGFQLAMRMTAMISDLKIRLYSVLLANLESLLHKVVIIDDHSVNLAHKFGCLGSLPVEGLLSNDC